MKRVIKRKGGGGDEETACKKANKNREKQLVKKSSISSKGFDALPASMMPLHSGSHEDLVRCGISRCVNGVEQLC